MNKFTRPIIYISLALIFIALSVFTYSVGNRSSASKSSAESNECEYSQREYEGAVKDLQGLRIEPLDNPYAGAPAPINENLIKDLEGECVIDALQKAGEIGIRIVRDLTGCWPDCVVTEDYSNQRINFHVEKYRMVDISVG